ncbi:hypothetical protein MAPG_07418 [Magnaporthiopsis poae ATCC 64411]|uniref:magnesium chelatase n=1 Tax=Magnaporthiopsis poae (strain ATCC 64411 / 73-15) TaxID=644358 RepID=A0A0C4E4M1_MAGP6|nr:hypothetical protein MAPG_07418 [Magnaporthiopsis poae ATCC 64411]
MADEELLDRVHSLSDLELAALLCLVSRENCLISTPPEALDDLVAELQLISSRTFGLKSVIIECGPHTTLEDFATGLLLPSQSSSSATARTGIPPGSGSGSPYARTHWHDPEDGFVNLEEEEQQQQQKEAEAAGAGLGGRDGTQKTEEPLLSEADIGSLARASQEVQIDIDVLRYLMNIASFLRVHRAVAGGVTPTSTRHFERLAKCMAALHRLDYVTPSLVAMAAKKIYLHRIRIVEPSKERSMQWGSELAAIEAMLEETGPEEVMDDVLSMVTPPL